MQSNNSFQQSRCIQDENQPSYVPLQDMLSNEQSIIMDSSDQIQTCIVSASGNTQQAHSIMENIPLLLYKEKNGIGQDNLVSKNNGIQKWKISKKTIGGGGSGDVYKALNINDGILSVVKKIHLCQEDQADSKKQIEILSSINHQNIVRYIQHYHLEEGTWIFMEYVPGTLKNFYKDFGPPPLETYLYFSKQLIIALDFLHKKKILHKDLKCANVLLTSKGILKLTDFGCSKGFDRTISMVNYQIQGSKTQKGTSYWMAPQSMTEGFYTIQTDIWSLGCTLLQLATGNIPWVQKKVDFQRIILQVGKNNDLPHIPQHIDEFVRTLIKSCINRVPKQRSSTEQLLALIDQYQKSSK